MTDPGFAEKQKKGISEEEFEANELTYVYSSCTLNSQEYYFVHGKNADGTPSEEVFLKHYDRQKGDFVQSAKRVFTHQYVRNRKVRSMAVTPNFFAFYYRPDSQGVLVLGSDWSGSEACFTHNYKSPNALPHLGRFLQGDCEPNTSVHKTGLARIREGTPGDFQLKSNDGGVIEVHKTILKPLWPFFSAAVDSNMSESTDNSMDLPFPLSTIEVAVRYLYGQPLELCFEDAARLLVMAKMYDLSELLSIAITKVKEVTLNTEQALMLWRQAFEADITSMREYSAAHVKEKMSDIASSELLDSMSKEELKFLFIDIASV